VAAENFFNLVYLMRRRAVWTEAGRLIKFRASITVVKGLFSISSISARSFCSAEARGHLEPTFLSNDPVSLHFQAMKLTELLTCPN
jgi:hypothetical protein